MLTTGNEVVQPGEPLAPGKIYDINQKLLAARLMELGVDIQTISALLGHESARTTLDFYGHSLTEQQIRAASLLASC